jgi:hypothetical protein
MNQEKKRKLKLARCHYFCDAELLGSKGEKREFVTSKIGFVSELYVMPLNGIQRRGTHWCGGRSLLIKKNGLVALCFKCFKFKYFQM